MIIISCCVLTILECKAPRPVHLTPQDTPRAPLPSFYCCDPTLCHSQPNPVRFPKTSVQSPARPPPRFYGKIQLNKAQASSRQDTQGLGDSGSRLSQRSRLPVPGPERFPTDPALSDQCEVWELYLCQYKSELRSWLGNSLIHQRTPSKFCFVFNFFGFAALPVPKPSKSPHQSLEINSGPCGPACGCLKCS